MSEQPNFSAARWAHELLTNDPQRILVSAGGKQVSAAELHEEVCRYRASLNQAGLAPDHIVAVACERWLSSIAVVLACLCENVAPFLIDARQDHDVLAKLLDAVRIHGPYCGTSIKQETFRARPPRSLIHI